MCVCVCVCVWLLMIFSNYWLQWFVYGMLMRILYITPHCKYTQTHNCTMRVNSNSHPTTLFHVCIFLNAHHRQTASLVDFLFLRQYVQVNWHVLLTDHNLHHFLQISITYYLQKSLRTFCEIAELLKFRNLYPRKKNSCQIMRYKLIIKRKKTMCNTSLKVI